MKAFLSRCGVRTGILLLLVSIVSTQIGSAGAKHLFVLAGPDATAALRLICATLVLFAVLRPWRDVPRSNGWKYVAIYGVCLGLMNSCFYQSISRIPLGIAVAIEFSGPLSVAVMNSRRWQDMFSVFLAVAGILLILPWGSVDASLDMTGIFFGALAGVFWACYIIFGRRAGGQAGTVAVAWGMLAGALTVTPWAALSSDFLLFDLNMLKQALPLAFLVGTLSSALPYGLEMVALRIVPQQAFGVMMSLEPAAAALFGFILLGETLAFRQWAAIALVVAASILVTRNAGRA